MTNQKNLSSINTVGSGIKKKITWDVTRLLQLTYEENASQECWIGSNATAISENPGASNCKTGSIAISCITTGSGVTTNCGDGSGGIPYACGAGTTARAFRNECFTGTSTDNKCDYCGNGLVATDTGKGCLDGTSPGAYCSTTGGGA